MNHEETIELNSSQNEENFVETESHVANQEKWVETKREYEVDEQGNEKIVKTTRELEKPKLNVLLKNKDLIDLILKFVGIPALVIPLLAIIIAQTRQSNREKGNRQIDVYSSTSILLHSLIDLDISKSKIDSLKSKMYFELYPKIKFLKDSYVIQQVDSIKKEINNYLAFSEITSRFKLSSEIIDNETQKSVEDYYDNKETFLKDSITLIHVTRRIQQLNFLITRSIMNSAQNPHFETHQILTTVNDNLHLQLSGLAERSFTLKTDFVRTHNSKLEYKEPWILGDIPNNNFKIATDTLDITLKKYFFHLDSVLNKLDSIFIAANSEYH